MILALRCIRFTVWILQIHNAVEMATITIIPKNLAVIFISEAIRGGTENNKIKNTTSQAVKRAFPSKKLK